MPIKVANSLQACALGAGIFGAVAAGLYSDVFAAQAALSSSVSKTYYPQSEQVALYQKIYQQYLKLGRTITDQLQEL